jgi:hypothetical protein
MLSIAFKNGLLMILIILSLHYLIKNHQIENFNEVVGFSDLSVTSNNMYSTAAPIGSEDVVHVASENNNDDELFNFLFSDRGLSHTFPDSRLNEEKPMFDGISPYESGDTFFKL